MTEKLHFYTDNPMMTACLFFSSIPFWVPVMAFLLNGTDPVLMFFTAVLSIISGIFLSGTLKAKRNGTFKNSLGYTLLKILFFLFIAAFLMNYGSLGDKGDIFIAAVCIIFVFYHFFIRSTDGFGFFNLMLWLFSMILWVGFLYGLGASYGISAFIVNIVIFHRQFGRAQ